MNPDRSSRAANSPVTFLHRLDGVRGDAMVVETDAQRLRTASFLDGREKFWTAERVVDLELRPASRGRTDRFIFHVGFCGSTLMARLLDDPAGTLVLKEPQCLVDLASQRRAISAGNAAASLESLTDHSLACMAQAGQGRERIVIKPSNWVNSILPSVCTPGRRARAVFLSMDRRTFMGAVFRGGRDRIEFCIRLAGEVAPVVAGGEDWLGEAIAIDDDPFERGARIVGLLHAMQESLFDQAIAANGWSHDVLFDFADMIGDPDRTAARARSILELPTPLDDTRSARVLERHTKDPARAFDRTERRREDEEIERHHGARFDAALDWLRPFSDAASR